MNQKSIALILIVQMLAVIAFTVALPFAAAAPSQLGQTTKGSLTAGQPSGVMVASRFTCTSNAVANSISAYIINPSSTSGPVKCAIYKESDQTLLASTEQKTLPAGIDGWQTFNFQSAPTLVADQRYSIVAWFGTTHLQICYGTGSASQSWYATQQFGNFPTGPYSEFSFYGQENLVYSLYATVTSSASSPTVTPTPAPFSTPTSRVQLGQTVKGTATSGQPIGEMVALEFTATSTAYANSVSAYVTNTNGNSGNVKCAIYKQSDDSLLATTEQKAIASGFSNWQTFNFASPPLLTVGSRYSVVAWFGSPGLQIAYTPTSSRQSWCAYQAYGNFPTGPCTSLSGYSTENVAYSLYVSASTTSQPVPPSSASPTPNPTRTPTPAPTRTAPTTPSPSVGTSARNLAVIPDAWGPGYAPNVPQYAFVDYAVTHNGNPSIRLQKGGDIDPFGVIDRSIWTNLYSCRPGDHIVASIWIKTDSSTTGDRSMGARLGIDLYGNGHIVDGYPGTHIDTTTNYVHWGTTTWTQRTYDFIVPNTVYTRDQTGASISGTQINGVLLWIQARPGEDGSSAWFSDAALYINP